jgi:hypothetical protein
MAQETAWKGNVSVIDGRRRSQNIWKRWNKLILELIHIFFILVAFLLSSFAFQSGLTKSVRNSKITMAEAESKVLEFLEKHTPPKKCPLTGETVTTDMPFLEAYMPRIVNHLLPRRIIDIQTVVDLSYRWRFRDVCNYHGKDRIFRSLNDIFEGIRKLKYHRDIVFKSERETVRELLPGAMLMGSYFFR